MPPVNSAELRMGAAPHPEGPVRLVALADDLVERALMALAKWIEQQAPTMAGKVSVVQADEEVTSAPPWVCVRPQHLRTEFFLGGGEEVDIATPGRMTVCVGEITGSIELVLAAPTKADRARVAPYILAGLLGGDDEASADRQGIVVLNMGEINLPGGAARYRPTCSFALNAGEWQDEKAFTRDRRHVLELDISLPLLVHRAIAGRMDELHLLFTRDMDSPADSVPSSDSIVSENGDTAPAT